jgi:ABC-2 type transport system permease protein
VTALVHAELIKLRTTRSWWAYLIVIALLTAIAVATEVGTASDDDRSSTDFQVGLVDTVGIAVLLTIILGITVVTSEFRHGTVTPTFLAAPQRERVIAAKAIAGVVVAVGFVLLSLFVIFAVATPWFAAVGAEWDLDGSIATRTGEQLLSAVLWVLMGVAVGAVVQSQVAALVGTLVWIFLGETLLAGLFFLLDLDGAIGYLPGQALDAASGTRGEDLLSYGPGVAVSFAWIALIGGAGTERTRRRDIT